MTSLEKKLAFVGVVLLGLFVAGVVIAAPTYTIQRTILPETDSTYELGASAREWLRLYSDNICLGGSCISSWSSAGTAFPFTTTTNYGATANATGTPIWFQAGLQASSTSYFVNASTTLISAGSGTVSIPAYSFTADPDTGIYRNTTNTISLSGGGAGVSWNGTAFYPNTTAVRDLGIASTNVWKNLHTTFATTTQLSIGSDFITDINGTGLSLSAAGVLSASLGGAVDLASEVFGTLPIANGGTGLSSVTANEILYGNAAGTAYVTTATSSLGLGVSGGGTGLTTCTNDRVVTGGATLNCEANFTYDGTTIDNRVSSNALETLLFIYNSSTDASAGVRGNIRTDGGGDSYIINQRVLTGASWSYGVESSDDSFRFNNLTTIGSADEFVITTGGNVGIGTTTPGYKLSVFGSASFGSSVSVNRRLDVGTDGAMNFWYSDNALRTFLTANNPGVDGANDGSQILFRQSSTTANIYDAGAIRSITEGAYTTSDNDNSALAFLTADSGTLSEALRLTSQNYAGFGVTNPGARVEAISTTTDATGKTFTTRSARAAIVTGNLLGSLTFDSNDTQNNVPLPTSASIRAFANGTHNTTSVPGSLTFSTTPASSLIEVERMRILSTGFVGIGTSTPPSIFTLHGASPKETYYDTSTSQLRTFTGALEKTFTYSTTTAWTGTTTIPMGPAWVAQTFSGVKCFTDTGTLNVALYDGTNRANNVNASTTVGTSTYTTNNTFTASEKRYIDVGTPASSPTSISCTFRWHEQ